MGVVSRDTVSHLAVPFMLWVYTVVRLLLADGKTSAKAGNRNIWRRTCYYNRYDHGHAGLQSDLWCADVSWFGNDASDSFVKDFK